MQIKIFQKIGIRGNLKIFFVFWVENSSINTGKSIYTHRQLLTHSTLSLIYHWKIPIRKFHPPLPISNFPDRSWRPRSLIPPSVGRELGLFSFSAAVSRLGKWYQVSLLFVFPWTFKKRKSGHWKGRGINPRGKTLALFFLLRTHPSNNKHMMKPEVKGLFFFFSSNLKFPQWMEAQSFIGLRLWPSKQIPQTQARSFLQLLWIDKWIMKTIPKGLCMELIILTWKWKGTESALNYLAILIDFWGQFIAV